MPPTPHPDPTRVLPEVRWPGGANAPDPALDSPDAWRTRFLDSYAQDPGIRKASLAAGVNPRKVHWAIQSDPEFATAVHVAYMMAADRLFEIAWEMATGMEEDVYHKGLKVGTRLVRDPEMVKFLLRAMDPQRFDPRTAILVTDTRYQKDTEAKMQMIADARERLKLLGKVVDAPDQDST